MDGIADFIASIPLFDEIESKQVVGDSEASSGHRIFALPPLIGALLVTVASTAFWR